MTVWAPWKDWADRRAEAEHERRISRAALARSAAERQHAAQLAARIRGRHSDAVAEQFEQAFRARPPDRGSR